jgi:hypothetical protein
VSDLHINYYYCLVIKVFFNEFVRQLSDLFYHCFKTETGRSIQDQLGLKKKNKKKLMFVNITRREDKVNKIHIYIFLYVLFVYYRFY